MEFVLEVFGDLPAAVFAFQIAGGKDEEEEARVAQAVEDSVTPVVHAADVVTVEKDAEFFAGKLPVVALDAGDVVAGVVAADIGEKRSRAMSRGQVRLECGGRAKASLGRLRGDTALERGLRGGRWVRAKASREQSATGRRILTNRDDGDGVIRQLSDVVHHFRNVRRIGPEFRADRIRDLPEALAHTPSRRMPKPMVPGSGIGATVTSRVQLFKVPVLIGETSATNSVHAPFGSSPLKEFSSAGRGSVSSALFGFVRRPSGCHIPLNTPPAGFTRLR